MNRLFGLFVLGLVGCAEAPEPAPSGLALPTQWEEGLPIPDDVFFDVDRNPVALRDQPGPFVVMAATSWAAGPVHKSIEDFAGRLDAEGVSLFVLLHQGNDGKPPTASDLMDFQSSVFGRGPGLVLDDSDLRTHPLSNHVYPSSGWVSEDLVWTHRLDFSD